MHVVRPIDVVTRRIPLVQIDAPEIDDPEQRRQVIDDRKVDDVAGVMVDAAGPDPGRARLRRPLHEEELTGGAVGIAFHHHRAIADVRQEHRRNVGVVLDQITLGDPLLLPEQLVEIGEPNVASGNLKSVTPCGGNRDAGRHATIVTG